MRVYVERDRTRLRIRVVYQGKKHQFSTGLTDTKTNRAYVQGVASRIELDMVSGQFDPTLLKYRPNAVGSNPAGVSCPELFEQYVKAIAKEKALHPGSLRRYQGCTSHVRKSLSVPAHQVTEATAGNFAAVLLECVSNRTAKEYLWMLASCWDWAQGRYHVADENPWTGQIQRIKPNPQQRVKPFTAAEIQAIIGALRSSPHYSHYSDFVYFLFGTGCRFGEAAGLRWSHVADDFRTVWIGESVSRGHRKSTKTGKSRTIVLPKLVAEMLTDRRQAKLIGRSAKPDDLVFPSPKGHPIDDHNFRSRAWKSILEECHIEYRKPYAVRHSVISHALANGANYIDVAQASGHDPKVMHQHYAHVIEMKSIFVEF
jgi:integrase